MSKKRTSTKSFGTGAREGHDASAFYSRFSPPELSQDNTVLAPHLRPVQDQIALGTAEDLLANQDLVADGSVALVVTSPPYFVGKTYEEAIEKGHVPTEYDEHLEKMAEIFRLCVDKLEAGGRIAINVANLGRKPFRSQASDIIAMLEDMGLLIRGEIIWRKGEGMNASTAWGSFQRPSNPVLRDLTERIVVASKGRFDRAIPQSKRQKLKLPHLASIYRDEFMSSTKDVWDIPAESASRVGHPAPFPVALPARLIDLFTYRDDLVLDPYIGSGTTAVAALRSGRHFIGCEAEQSYIDLANERIEAERAALEACQERRRSAGINHRLRIANTAQMAEQLARIEQSSSEIPVQVRVGMAKGLRAKDVAESLLEACGFEVVAKNRNVGAGIVVDFVAQSKDSTVWHFMVVGSFGSEFHGLQRGELLWKTLAQAALHHHLTADDGQNISTAKAKNTKNPVEKASSKGPRKAPRLVILTPALAESSSFKKALTAAKSAGHFFEALEIASPQSPKHLTQFNRAGKKAVAQKGIYKTDVSLWY